jgi:hypothetical protein
MQEVTDSVAEEEVVLALEEVEAVEEVVVLEEEVEVAVEVALVVEEEIVIKMMLPPTQWTMYVITPIHAVTKSWSKQLIHKLYLNSSEAYTWKIKLK